MDFFIRWIFGAEDDDVVNNDVVQVPQEAAQAPQNAANEPLNRAVTFKITAQDFGKFDGKPEHWYGFKNKTLSTLGVAGFSSILDPARPIVDEEGNRRLYYLFEGATNEGSASHIVKHHRATMDGRAAWQSLKDWYEGRTTSGDIAKTCRTKLLALELNPKGDANAYINEFIRLKEQLEDMGEGERSATLIEQFLDQIKDPKYDVTVTTLRMDNNKTLESCIEAVRRYDLVLTRQRIQDHRLTKIRRLPGMEDVTDEGAGVQSSSYIAPEIWRTLTPEQRKAIIQARQKDSGKPKDDSNANPMTKRERNRARRAKAKAKRDTKNKQESQKSATGEKV
jgi:hypothetical protein